MDNDLEMLIDATEEALDALPEMNCPNCGWPREHRGDKLYCSECGLTQ